ncbi:MAG: hypothetical protein K2Y02_04785 [Burkholderiaceae bacterium]|nr:hypothetical protein [Burkholderiaceae bacterium]
MQPGTCGECGKAVAVLDGEVIRGCTHVTASVIVSLSATVYGAAEVAQGVPEALALAAPGVPAQGV